MSKRSRRLSLIPPAAPKPMHTRPMSDRHQLDFTNIMAPLQGLLAQVNQVAANTQEQVALLLAREAGLDPADGWRLNVGKARWEKHSVPKDA